MHTQGAAREKQRDKAFAFISASGGVGKTTLALTFSYYLTKVQGVRRLLIVDLDPTAGLSLLTLGDELYEDQIDLEKTLSDMFERYRSGYNVKVEDFVTKLPHEKAAVKELRADLLVPGERLMDVVNELWKSSFAGVQFEMFFAKTGIYSGYDVVVIDSAPFFEPRYTMLSLVSAGHYLIPLRPSLVDFRRTLRMLDNLRREGEAIWGAESAFRSRCLAVLNLVPARTSQAEHVFAKEVVKSGATVCSKGHLLPRGFVETFMRIKALIDVCPFFVRNIAAIQRLDFEDALKELKPTFDYIWSRLSYIAQTRPQLPGSHG